MRPFTPQEWADATNQSHPRANENVFIVPHGRMVGPILDLRHTGVRDGRELKLLRANEVLSHGTGCLSGMGDKRRDREVRAILRLSSI